MTRRANQAQIHTIAEIIAPAPQERQRALFLLPAMFAKSVSIFPIDFAAFSLKFDTSGKPLRSAPNVELLAGTIIQGTPYVATYNNSDGAFYLRGFFGNPYNIPLGAGFDYWAPNAPNSCFAFPYGQAISRTAYATLFALFGTTYGSGDGSTTFNLPDLRGRVAIAADNMGGSQAGRVSAVLGSGLGSVGGEQQHTLTIGEIPAHNHSVTINDPGHTHVANNISGFIGSGTYGPTTNGGSYEQPLSLQYATTGISVAIGNNGGGAAHNNLQPSIVCNYIIRII